MSLDFINIFLSKNNNDFSSLKNGFFKSMTKGDQVRTVRFQNEYHPEMTKFKNSLKGMVLP
jgi:hypothetical protein